ncbi:hypothetical protein E2C01_075778 [Portunus trituberculatus]|uniref:Uncharacterized protein n=1 Tax=Portunus trituberculatus TaxID=210409 RepID=A0A5B7IBI6_PORTR|nr:hypothetical protein [Portunus trituberculatus]
MVQTGSHMSKAGRPPETCNLSRVYLQYKFVRRALESGAGASRHSHTALLALAPANHQGTNTACPLLPPLLLTPVPPLSPERTSYARQLHSSPQPHTILQDIRRHTDNIYCTAHESHHTKGQNTLNPC